MRIKYLFAIAILAAVLPVLADDAPQPPLPPYVQAINAKYDKHLTEAQRAYWQVVLTADKEKLKDMQDALVTAAGKNDTDSIPNISKLIEETKTKIKQDTAASGAPVATVADNPAALADFKWLIGIRWKYIGDHDATLNFLSDHSARILDSSGVHILNWRALDASNLLLIDKADRKAIYTFSRTHNMVMGDAEGGTSLWKHEPN